MSKKLFVGNLPFYMTEDQLQALFVEHGKVSSTNLIMDKYSGQSRGFGFIEMDDDAAAEAAVTKLNNSLINGRNIVVNEARPMKERSSSSPSGSGRWPPFPRSAR